MRRTWGLVSAGLLVLSGCETGDPITFEDPPLVITIDAPELVEVPIASSLQLTVHVRHADGSAATNYELTTITSCNCALLADLTLTGTEQLTVKSSNGGYGTTLRLRGKVPDSSYAALSEPHWLVALRERPMELQPLVSTARMAVGEQRSFVAVGNTSGRPAGGPNLFSTSNAIAEVDEAGVVTARMAGQTTLTISNRGPSTTVEITVDPVARTGPPPEGVQRLGLPLTGNGIVTVGRTSSMLDHTMVVDSRGYPHALLSVVNRSLLMSWTGTGFGYELLPDAYSGITSSYLTIDERDQLYVVSATDFGAFVFDKLASSPSSAWRKRPLSQRVDALDRGDGDVTRYARQVERVTLLPRAGGGVDVVYAFVVGPVPYAYPCGAIYRHAEVTTDAVTLSDVTSDWGPPALDGQCPALKSFDAQSMVLVPRGPGEVEFQLPYGNRLGASAMYDGIGRFHRVSPNRWDVDAVPQRHESGGFPRPAPSFSLNAFAMGDGGYALFEGLADATKASPFSFNSLGRVWVGDTSIITAYRAFDPFGYSGVDTMADVFDVAPVTAWGVVGDARKVHAVSSVVGRSVDELVYLSRTIPSPVVSRTSPEVEGRFVENHVLTDGGEMSTLVSAPALFADGTRALLGFGGTGVPSPSFGRVFRSRETNVPWSPGAPVLLSQHTSMVQWGGALYATAYGEQLTASADLGASWTSVSEAAATHTDATQQVVAVAGGVAADMGASIALWPNPSPTDAGLVLWPVTPLFHFFTPMPSPLYRNLFNADGGVYFVAALASAPNPELYIARVAWDGGLVSERAPNTNIQYVRYLVRQGAQVSPEEIVFPSWTGGNPPFAVMTNRVNLETGAWEIGDAGAFSDPNPTVLALRDGGLVLGGTMTSQQLNPDGGFARQDRAVLLTSADGLHWSAPRLLRDFGGDSQVIQFMADDGQGGVLVVVEDSLRMGSTRPKQLVQRVVLP